MLVSARPARWFAATSGRPFKRFWVRFSRGTPPLEPMPRHAFAARPCAPYVLWTPCPEDARTLLSSTNRTPGCRSMAPISVRMVDGGRRETWAIGNLWIMRVPRAEAWAISGSRRLRSPVSGTGCVTGWPLAGRGSCGHSQARSHFARQTFAQAVCCHQKTAGPFADRS